MIQLHRPGLGPPQWCLVECEIYGVPLRLNLDLNLPTQRYIFDCLKGGCVYEGASTRAIVDALRLGDVFFDVGANCGWFSAIAGARGARVVAFEPADCDALIRNAPNSIVVKAAVTDKAGSVTLYLNLDNEGGHALWQAGLHPYNIETAKAGNPHTRVPSVRLDDYASYAPAVIKIDTEGAECDILLGAEKVLNQPTLRMVVCERHEMGLQLLDHSPEEVESIMRRHGFTWEQPNVKFVNNWIFRR